MNGVLWVKLELLGDNNIKEVFEFESKNKDFFESILPSRPNGYFDYTSFSEIMSEIIDEQKDGQCFMHIIRDENKKLIGRINLHSVDGHFFELGYRLGYDTIGKGYGSKAVKKIIELAFIEYGINIITAGTSSKNIPSQKVLLKNGFTFIKEEKAVLKINEEVIDGYIYELIKS